MLLFLYIEKIGEPGDKTSYWVSHVSRPFQRFLVCNNGKYLGKIISRVLLESQMESIYQQSMKHNVSAVYH